MKDILFLSLSLMVFGLTRAQQLTDYTWDWESLNLTDSCFSAVNTTVPSCSELLATQTTWSGSVGLMDEAELAVLCVSQCRTDLDSLRTTIAGACTGDQDVVTYDDTVYPATFALDNLLNTYDVSCYKDASSGTYCDLILAEWRNETNSTDNHDCEDCTLGPFKLQLESVVGYSDDWAEDFASMTSSCGATDYTWTSPGTYGSTVSKTASTTATSTSATATQSCSSTYTVQTNDTCNSIAATQNVSTYNLMIANSFTIICSNLPDVGTEICIPATCTTATLLHGNSCDGFMSDWNASMAKVLTWNPIIDDSCDNLHLFVGWTLCAGPTNDWSPNITETATTTSAATAVSLPTNGMTSSNQDCAGWYTVGTNDDCATISVTAGISLDEFLFLNPEVWENCTNLWVNYAYCVEPVGSISTYSGWEETTASTIFTKPATTTTTTPTPGPTYTNTLAPGTNTNCEVYRDAINSTSNPLSSFGISTIAWSSLGLNITTCDFWTDSFGTTKDDMIAWNPSLNDTSCVLKMGYSYCMLISYDYLASQQTNQTVDGSSCLNINSTTIMPSTVSDCNCYTLVYGKESDGVDCDSLLGGEFDYYTITQSELIDMNPWLGTGDCDTALFANLTGENERAVCIGTGAVSSSTALVTSTPMTTVGSSTIYTSTPTSSAASSTITAQPGEIDTCNKWHEVVSGDTCYDIASSYDITLDIFYQWNPQLNNACTALWLGYGVCVGVST